jgi:hypothetical protein
VASARRLNIDGSAPTQPRGREHPGSRVARKQRVAEFCRSQAAKLSSPQPRPGPAQREQQRLAQGLGVCAYARGVSRFQAAFGSVLFLLVAPGVVAGLMP